MDSSVAPPQSQEFDQLSFFWGAIVRTVLNPLFNDDNEAVVPLSGQTMFMSSIVSERQFDQILFPYIHERLPRFVSNYYSGHVLAPLLAQTDGAHMVASLQESWYTCAHKTSIRIEEALKPFEDDYRQAIGDFQLASIRKVVLHQFRSTVFDQLLGSVQQFGFSCISRDGIITNGHGLWSVHMLIESVSTDTMTHCATEWDRPVMDRIFRSFAETMNSWTTITMKSFLAKIGFRLLQYRTIFMYEENQLEAKRRLLQAVSGFRDELIFCNDAANLRNLLQKEEHVPELKKLFRFFGDDHKFLQAISAHSGEYFKELLFGDNHESDEEPLRDGVFGRFLLTWKRMHSILRTISTKRAFEEAILAPLTRFIGNCPKPSDKIWHTQKFLAEHVHSLLSINGNGKQILAASKQEEIFEIVSLAAYMTSTERFAEVHRVLLSKRLLSDTTLSQNLENLVLKVLPKRDFVSRHGIKIILSDAQRWPLYQNENFGTLHSKQNHVLIEPKVINRTYWHLEEDPGFVLNPQLQITSKHISEYFKSKHPYQVCSVHSTAGHAIIRTKVWHFEGDSVRVKLTTGQLSLLSLFEKSKKLSVRQICTLLTEKEENDQTEFLFNLIRSMTARVPILEKEPNVRNIEDTDMICLNECFLPEASLLTLPIPEGFKKALKPEDENTFQEREEDLLEFQRQCFETIIIKVLKERMRVEFKVLKQIVFAEVGQKIALGDEIFEEAVRGLEKRHFLATDGYIVRYVV